MFFRIRSPEMLVLFNVVQVLDACGPEATAIHNLHHGVDVCVVITTAASLFGVSGIGALNPWKTLVFHGISGRNYTAIRGNQRVDA